MPMWNPRRGCKRCSEGCLHCCIHKDDAKRDVDTSMIVKTKDFDKPIAQLKIGGYKMKPGLVSRCSNRSCGGLYADSDTDAPQKAMGTHK